MLNILLITTLLLSGCATWYVSSATRKSYVDSHQDINQDIKESILKGQIIQGMTTEQVKASWGQPSQVTTSSNGMEMWNYYSSNFLYFYNGKLANWTQTQ